jgi:hypothetical protein
MIHSWKVIGFACGPKGSSLKMFRCDTLRAYAMINVGKKGVEKGFILEEDVEFAAKFPEKKQMINRIGKAIFDNVKDLMEARDRRDREAKQEELPLETKPKEQAP